MTIRSSSFSLRDPVFLVYYSSEVGERKMTEHTRVNQVGNACRCANANTHSVWSLY